jgi:1,4-dihydroxy-2-naphthoate polyprenyltransferase
MTKQVAAPMEPCFEDLAGDDPGKRARKMFLATRPKFLTASLLPVIVGTAWGYAVSGHFSVAAALLAILATALVHAASNVINDVGDESTGGDRLNVERIYPYTGGSRFIQNQIMTAAEMNRLGYGLLAAAGLLGLVLAILKGPLVVAFGLAGIAIALLYSLPSVQLAGRGVGELCITVAFGLLPVCGAAWLQSAVVDWRSVLVAVPVGLWVTLILLINEVPDRNADAASGKRTLAVRLGIDGTRKLYLALHLAAFGCVLALSATGLMPWWIAAGAAVILAGGVRASKGIGDPVTGRGALTKSIEMTLGLQAAGSILLLLGALFSNA